MSDLIERLERATGPDRELDIDIQAVVNPERHSWLEAEVERLRQAALRNGLTNRHEACYRAAFGESPQYTASIDAAMTLVPEGYIWDKISVPNDETSTALVFAKGVDSSMAVHKKFPLALCIAAIRARASAMGEKV